ALKTEPRPGPPDGPGGMPDGTYLEDYEFTGEGDLDRCNGMTVNGQYGYYVTTTYPWVLNCFVGKPDASFNK
ncbi:MAG: YHYH protein, partial [Pseudomonadota bacterium]